MTGVPLYRGQPSPQVSEKVIRLLLLQGYLAHQKKPTPLGPPWDPTHRPTVGSLAGAFVLYVRYPSTQICRANYCNAEPMAPTSAESAQLSSAVHAFR